MVGEPELAFCVRDVEPPGVEVRVNFGVFAGRGATAAEIDDLASALLPKVGEVSIVAEQRHEIGPGAEASLNQVRIEVAPEQLPEDEHELDILSAAAWSRPPCRGRAAASPSPTPKSQSSSTCNS
jgi:hypothetical protein